MMTVGLTHYLDRHTDDIWHMIFQRFDDEPGLNAEQCGRLAQAASAAIEQELVDMFDDD